MITVSTVRRNKQDALNVKVDRTSILGNPFYMHNELMRDEVCDKFEAHFKVMMANKGSPFYMEVYRLYVVAKTQDLNIQCHCSPRRCHADTIKRFLDAQLSNISRGNK